MRWNVAVSLTRENDILLLVMPFEFQRYGNAWDVL